MTFPSLVGRVRLAWLSERGRARAGESIGSHSIDLGLIGEARLSECRGYGGKPGFCSQRW